MGDFSCQSERSRGLVIVHGVKALVGNGLFSTIARTDNRGIEIEQLKVICNCQSERSRGLVIIHGLNFFDSE